MKLLDTALRFLKRHDTQIMTGIAIAGAVATPILASRATLKAKEAIDELEEEISPDGVNPENEGETEEVTTADKVMTAAPYYIWTVLALGTTIFCIVRCEKLHLGREASLMGISAFWEHRYKTLNSKFIDKCGEEAVCCGFLLQSQLVPSSDLGFLCHYPYHSVRNSADPHPHVRLRGENLPL